MNSDKQGKEEFPTPRPPERPSLAEICLPLEPGLADVHVEPIAPPKSFQGPSESENTIDDLYKF